MQLHFYKYQGTGNDFIIIDNREKIFTAEEQRIAGLCHRRFGIGADGLMLLESNPGSDFAMRYFNADGKESTMCGNGGRCMAAFAHKLGLAGTHVRFRAIDGMHEAFVDTPSYVRLKMQDVQGLEILGKDGFLNTGSPHYVKWVDHVKELNVVEEGRKIRYHERFKPGGTNVNFIERMDENTLFVRTYERGVEDETLSCGTGVTASAIFAGMENKNDKVTYSILTLGGQLTVRYHKAGDNQWTDIWLEGPADFVFEGDITLK